MKTHFLIAILVLLLSGQAYAQTRVVSGTVKDGSGEPLIGATVVEAGSINGAITNINGEFSITVDSNAMLKIDYLGHTTQKVSVKGQKFIAVTLQEDAAHIDEVVVIGYGTQKRSTMTSAIATVSAKEVTKQVSQNVASALQGRAAGVDVIQQGGVAGADVNIVIRGAASLTATEPLYIVDGVFTNNGLTTINPADIESIEILKDGAAAAIYGSRAANGVVIITTKKGTKGTVKVDINASYSIQQVTNTPDFLNASQWRTFANMVSDNSGLARAPENENPTDPSIDTDWAREWLQFAPMTNVDASISGGNEHGNYSFSLGYLDQTGLTRMSEFQRYNMRTNSSWKFGRFFVSENVAATIRNRTPTQSFNIGMPTLAVTDEQGRYASWDSEYYIESENARRNNPFAALSAIDRFTSYFDVLGGVSAGVNILEGLTYTMSLNGNYSTTHGYTHTPVYYSKWNEDGSPDTDYGNPRNSLSESRGATYNYTWDNVINFNRTFSGHTFNATLGHSWMREFYRGQSYETIEDVGAPNIVGVTNVPGRISSGEKNTALLSFFGRLNYDYDNRYLLSATVRRDESSKFHKDNRVGYFPSISGGWNAHNEEWFKNNVLSLLKVTASYGELGANFLEPYNFDNIAFGPIAYTVAGQRFVDGRAAYLKNKGLIWETSKTTDVGIELGFLDNALTFGTNYFYKKNVDLLTTINLNLSSGQIFEINSSRETPYVNTASVENKGFEFMLNYRKYLTKDFFLGVSTNISTLSNKVLALGDNVQPITAGSYSSSFNDAATITIPGHAIGSFYGYKIDGFDHQGNFAYNDKNGDGIINAEDKYILGDAIPDFSYGINIEANYKNFDLTMFFNGVYGNEIFNAKKYDYYFNYANNMVAGVLDSWTATNPSASAPIAKVTNNAGGNALPSEFYIEDGSYLRLKNIQLGYTLPDNIARKMKMQKLRLHVSVQNVFTITSYTGYDPEVSSNALFSRGVDLNSYPNARTYSFGASLSF
ncbi:MAG: SusC/RagA family TonB-linked outer membrane protein [Bacteroidales bacterium]